MAKQKNAKPQDEAMDSGSKIEAIKQLIFGENIEQYDSEFHTLKQEIQDRKKELEDYIDQVRNELMQSIDSMTTDINIRITDLEDALNDKTDGADKAKVNKEELGDLLIKLGEKLRRTQDQKTTCRCINSHGRTRIPTRGRNARYFGFIDQTVSA